MRKAEVYYNGEKAGVLVEQHRTLFKFVYDESWLANPNKPAISLTLPKSQGVYTAKNLFPFFFHLLSEGVNRQVQCRQLRIDESDHFGLLLATATDDTVGAVTVQEIPEV